MKKIVTSLAVILLLFVGVYLQKPDTVIGQSALQPGVDLLRQVGTATNTPVFLQTGIATSTTDSVSTSMYENLNLAIQVFASSSPTGIAQNLSTLSIQQQASHNNVDWYDVAPLDVPTGPSQFMPVASTSVPYRFQPKVSGATSTLIFSVKPVSARFTRFQFSVASSSQGQTFKDGYNLYAEVLGVK